MHTPLPDDAFNPVAHTHAARVAAANAYETAGAEMVALQRTVNATRTWRNVFAVTTVVLGGAAAGMMAFREALHPDISLLVFCSVGTLLGIDGIGKNNRMLREQRVYIQARMAELQPKMDRAQLTLLKISRAPHGRSTLH